MPRKNEKRGGNTKESERTHTHTHKLLKDVRLAQLYAQINDDHNRTQRQQQQHH